jgi:hypothetical protein
MRVCAVKVYNITAFPSGAAADPTLGALKHTRRQLQLLADASIDAQAFSGLSI